MNKQSLKKLFVFIITTMMFSTIPAMVNAQKKCPEGNCPKGQVCVNGICTKSSGGNGGSGNGGGGYCNCSVRPIPFECGQICGWIALTTSNSSHSQQAAITFSINKAEKISAKIFDMNGRLVRTFADKIFEKGEHNLQWDAAGVNAGIYIVQFNAGTNSEMKKISIIN